MGLGIFCIKIFGYIGCLTLCLKKFINFKNKKKLSQDLYNIYKLNYSKKIHKKKLLNIFKGNI
jgi:hypothetical protein